MKDIKYIVTIVLLILGSIFIYSSMNEKIKDLKREQVIFKDSLRIIDSTQYSKIIADTLTERQLRKRIEELEIENAKKPKIITEIQWKVRDSEKVVDTIYLPKGDSKLYVSDYYPNKYDPFVNYTLKDTIGKFKFYPINTAIVVSENKDGTWKVDTKTPEFIEITNITAVGLKKEFEPKTSPFYIGGGVQKQGERYPISALGGFRVKRTIIFGGLNTEGQVEIKTLYNL